MLTYALISSVTQSQLHQFGVTDVLYWHQRRLDSVKVDQHQQALLLLSIVPQQSPLKLLL